MDLSRFDAAPLTAFTATKETNYGHRKNGYCESFNGRMRDELLNGEIYYALREAQTIIDSWRIHHNTK
jgi:hypothetical protein